MKNILSVIALLLCGATVPWAEPPATPELATRNARYWMTHVSGESASPECATLMNAIVSSGGQLDLGFIVLPLEDRDRNGVTNAQDALVEALGLYWRGSPGPPLNDKNLPALVCKRRKQLAVELIAATANTVYLGTSPTNFMQTADVPFPEDLLEQAREASRGVQPDQMAVFIAALREFNNAGLTNTLGSGLVECAPENIKELHKISRIPTTQANCRGSK